MGVHLSVVIPTYRGSRTLEELVARLDAVLAPLDEGYEVIIVDDASPDAAFDVAERLAQKYRNVHALELFRNQGQALATMCGLEHARGDIVITMDDDLQHPPEEIPKLLEALDRHPEWDAVVATWSRDDSGLRNLGSRFYAWADRVANGTPKSFRHTAFRALRRGVVEALLGNETRAPVVGPLLNAVSARVVNVEVEHATAESRHSRFRYGEGLRRTANNFMQGSILPLRALSAFGLAACALSVLAGVIVTVDWALGANTPPGWLSVFLATLFFGGAILLGIGTLGVYLQLIVREVRRPPRWNVRRSVGGPE